MDPCSTSSDPAAATRRLVALRSAYPSIRPRPVWMSAEPPELHTVTRSPRVADALLGRFDELRAELDLDGAVDVRSARSLLDPAGNNLTIDAEDEPRRYDVAPSVVIALSHRHGAAWTERVRLAILTSFALGEKTAERYLRCGTLGAVEVAFEGGVPKKARLTGSRCRCRWCETCQRRHGDALRPGIVRLVESYSWPLLLTLTLRHGPDDTLRALIDRLLLGWKRLRRTVALRAVTGGVRILEIKRSAEGWHPHLHVLCDARWLNREEVRAAWEQASGGSTVIDVRRIRTPDEASGYVAKYLTKTTTFDDPLHFLEYLAATKGIRFAATFGDSVGTPLLLDPENTPDTPDDDEGLLWLTVGPLWKLVSDSAQGDQLATAILDLLLPDWHFAEPRASPPPTFAEQSLPF